MLPIPLLVGKSAHLPGASRIADPGRAQRRRHRRAHHLHGLAIGVAIERPSVDQTWLSRARRPQQFRGRRYLDPAQCCSRHLIGCCRRRMPVARCPTAALRQPSWVVCCSWSVVRSRPSTADAILLLAFELALIPMWVLITRFGDLIACLRAEAGGARPHTAVGSDPHAGRNLLLVASAHSSDLGRLLEVAPSLPRGRQLTIALLLTVGLRRQGALFPLHTWLPSAHIDRPPPARCCWSPCCSRWAPMASSASRCARARRLRIIAPAVAIAAAISILWGGLICLVERDLQAPDRLLVGGAHGLCGPRTGTPAARSVSRLRSTANSPTASSRPRSSSSSAASSGAGERRPGPGLAGPS